MCCTKKELESKVQELRNLRTMKVELEDELKAVEREIVSYMTENGIDTEITVLFFRLKEHSIFRLY